MRKKRSIAPVVRKKSLTEPDRDVHYWRRRTVAARIAQVEKLRREYILWKYDTYPPLERVVHIIPLSESRGTWWDEQQRAESRQAEQQEHGSPGEEEEP